MNKGGVVAIPTETVYGLAAVATHTDAVKRVFAIKQRPALDPLIVHLHDQDLLKTVAWEVPEKARQLANAFWPGPLTLVLPKLPVIPDLVTAGRDTVAIRIPAHPVTRDILALTGAPLAAPSANPFGRVSPTRAEHVIAQLGDDIDGIVDGGTCEIGLESTIVGFWDERIWLLRQGGVTQESIESVVGTIELYRPKHQDDIRAPGTMPRHYAPSIPLRLSPYQPSDTPSDQIARLTFGPLSKHDQKHSGPIFNLSPQGSTEEAARNLYEGIRKLDQSEARWIIADLLPDDGIGKAVNDRLRRAATQ